MVVGHQWDAYSEKIGQPCPCQAIDAIEFHADVIPANASQSGPDRENDRWGHARK
jgi:hypothetical protein